MAPPTDKDWEYLDRVISLADDIIVWANETKENSDDPDILYQALKTESAALMIMKLSREYRPRLRYLKRVTGSIDYDELGKKGKRSATQTSSRENRG